VKQNFLLLDSLLQELQRGLMRGDEV